MPVESVLKRVLVRHRDLISSRVNHSSLSTLNQVKKRIRTEIKLDAGWLKTSDRIGNVEKKTFGAPSSSSEIEISGIQNFSASGDDYKKYLDANNLVVDKKYHYVAGHCFYNSIAVFVENREVVELSISQAGHQREDERKIMAKNVKDIRILLCVVLNLFSFSVRARGYINDFFERSETITEPLLCQIPESIRLRVSEGEECNIRKILNSQYIQARVSMHMESNCNEPKFDIWDYANKPDLIALVLALGIPVHVMTSHSTGTVTYQKYSLQSRGRVVSEPKDPYPKILKGHLNCNLSLGLTRNRLPLLCRTIIRTCLEAKLKHQIG